MFQIDLQSWPVSDQEAAVDGQAGTGDEAGFGTDRIGDHSSDLVRLPVTVHGMAVQAAGGATRKELRRVVAMALRSQPGVN